jgi:hypothetical protein
MLTTLLFIMNVFGGLSFSLRGLPLAMPSQLGGHAAGWYQVQTQGSRGAC